MPGQPGAANRGQVRHDAEGRPARKLENKRLLAVSGHGQGTAPPGPERGKVIDPVQDAKALLSIAINLMTS